ncbi:MAG: hypothetical protein ACFCUQ_09025, partial [Kiloniellales bacterium]
MPLETPSKQKSEQSSPIPGSTAAQVSDPLGRVTTIELPEGFFPTDNRIISAKDFYLLAALPVLAAIAWSCSDAACL